MTLVPLVLYLSEYASSLTNRGKKVQCARPHALRKVDGVEGCVLQVLKSTRRVRLVPDMGQRHLR